MFKPGQRRPALAAPSSGQTVRCFVWYFGRRCSAGTDDTDELYGGGLAWTTAPRRPKSSAPSSRSRSPALAPPRGAPSRSMATDVSIASSWHSTTTSVLGHARGDTRGDVPTRTWSSSVVSRSVSHAWFSSWTRSTGSCSRGARPRPPVCSICASMDMPADAGVHVPADAGVHAADINVDVCASGTRRVWPRPAGCADVGDNLKYDDHCSHARARAARGCWIASTSPAASPCCPGVPRPRQRCGKCGPSWRVDDHDKARKSLQGGRALAHVHAAPGARNPRAAPRAPRAPGE